MKKIKFFVIWICFIILPIIGSAAAQDSERDIHSFEDWDFITNDTGLTLTAYRGTAHEVEIPGQIYDIAVTVLADNLFKNNSYLQKISIPDSVSKIGTYAFQGCTSLTDVRLPARLSLIDTGTFRYCTSLRQITLPETLTTITSQAFSGCISLESIVIPDSVTSIGEMAFDDCTALQNITISNNLHYLGGNAFRNTPWLSMQTDEFVLIGDTILLRWNGTDSFVEIPYGVTMITDAFSGNNNLESILLPASVTRIGPNAFRDTVNLKSILIPDTVTRIDGYAFNGCRSLRSIDLPESINIIGNQAFRGCEKLTSFDFPKKITEINSYVLSDCIALTDVVIPDGVQSIHEMAFSGSPNIRYHVTYDSEGETFAREHNLSYTYYLQQTKDFIYSKNEEGIQILKYIGNLFDVDVPETIDGLPVNRINTAAFQNNNVARRITLPDSVKSIGDWAFSYMDFLESIRISANLKELGADAFTGSGKLSSVSLPDSLEVIGAEPFEGIDPLTLCASSGSNVETALMNMGYVVSGKEMCSGMEYSAVYVTSVSLEATPTGEPTHLANDNTVDKSTMSSENTAIMTPTAMDMPTMTATMIPTATDMPTMTATMIPTATDMPTMTATMIPTATDMPTMTLTNTATMTPTVTNTPTMTLTNTATMTPTVTNTPTMTPTMTPTHTITPTPKIRYVVYIPIGETEITPNMLTNTAEILTLVIPSSVTKIDESILEGHTLTIVSESGTEAENFARKYDLKFLISTWYEAPTSVPEGEL